MTARVITDPSALGWVLDPDTGRWEWSGSGDGGGYDDAEIKADLAQETEDRINGDQFLQDQIDGLGSGGSAVWELVAEYDFAGASAISCTEITDEYSSWKFVADGLLVSPSGRGQIPLLQYLNAPNDANVLTSNYSYTEYGSGSNSTDSQTGIPLCHSSRTLYDGPLSISILFYGSRVTPSYGASYGLGSNSSLQNGAYGRHLAATNTLALGSITLFGFKLSAVAGITGKGFLYGSNKS